MNRKLFRVSVVGLLVLTFTHGLEQIHAHNHGQQRPNRDTVQIKSNELSFRKTLEKYSQSATSTENCTDLLSEELIDEIGGYKEIAENIIELIVNGDFKGKTFQELEELVVRYPQRPSGHQSLEDSIDYMMDRMRHYGLVNVRGEQVPVSHWIRGEEKAEMVEPHRKSLRMLGLGRTVGTPEVGITGEVIVVKSFADLDAKKDKVKGKIVVYNQGWQGSYGATKDYRASGASYASQHGAIAALIESVASFSLDTPHTGGQNYWSNVSHIPAACITMEDADYLYRLQEKGKTIKIHLKMLDYNLPITTSRNVIGELIGKTKPMEYVAVTGHIDSWDVGQGTMDDGGGIMISVMALAALKHLNLQPSRTLQAILWTSEEVGLEGVQGFVRQHRNQLTNYSAVFESDTGTFRPRGLDFAGSERAGCIVNEVLKLTSKINTTDYARYDTVSSDITYLIAEGVPGLSLNTENDKYFWYHHTEADTMAMMDSEELDLDTALWAVTSYVLSDISEKLPRNPPTSSS